MLSGASGELTARLAVAHGLVKDVLVEGDRKLWVLSDMAWMQEFDLASDAAGTTVSLVERHGPDALARVTMSMCSDGMCFALVGRDKEASKSLVKFDVRDRSVATVKVADPAGVDLVRFIPKSGQLVVRRKSGALSLVDLASNGGEETERRVLDDATDVETFGEDAVVTVDQRGRVIVVRAADSSAIAVVGRVPKAERIASTYLGSPAILQLASTQIAIVDGSQVHSLAPFDAPVVRSYALPGTHLVISLLRSGVVVVKEWPSGTEQLRVRVAKDGVKSSTFVADTATLFVVDPFGMPSVFDFSALKAAPARRELSTWMLEPSAAAPKAMKSRVPDPTWRSHVASGSLALVLADQDADLAAFAGGGVLILVHAGVAYEYPDAHLSRAVAFGNGSHRAAMFSGTRDVCRADFPAMSSGPRLRCVQLASGVVADVDDAIRVVPGDSSESLAITREGVALLSSSLRPYFVQRIADESRREVLDTAEFYVADGRGTIDAAAGPPRPLADELVITTRDCRRVRLHLPSGRVVSSVPGTQCPQTSKPTE